MVVFSLTRARLVIRVHTVADASVFFFRRVDLFFLFFCAVRGLCGQAERMDLMCKCQRQEQQVADLRKLVDEIAKLESGAPDASGSGGDNSGNWETQSVCSDVSGVSRPSRSTRACLLPVVSCHVPPLDRIESRQCFVAPSCL